MYLKYIQIINFKNLKSARFEFAKGANTIIGENDSGKSNALTAMRILLDDSYYYNTKRLRETDFSYILGDWKGHWIIISAFFDEISDEDKINEFCAELTPDKENGDFLRSYIRCADKCYGTVTLFIRPCRSKRLELAEASRSSRFETIRSQIKLGDYEFIYTSRSQADFTDETVYKSIVGDISAGEYANPENDDSSVLGSESGCGQERDQHYERHQQRQEPSVLRYSFHISLSPCSFVNGWGMTLWFLLYGHDHKPSVGGNVASITSNERYYMVLCRYINVRFIQGL